MAHIELYPYQADALERMHNGCILDGGVGTGKSAVSLAYIYTRELKGTMCINGKGSWSPPTENKDIYIITTAKKRNSKEWEDELIRFDLSTDPEHSINNLKVTIDSWNNIKKYASIIDSIFIFDEDRVVGSGAWSKAFITITRSNRWILLSASPGDTYSDYIPVLIANGFYRNRTQFYLKHVIWRPFVKFHQVDHYINTDEVDYYISLILVHMIPPEEKLKVKHDIWCNYDKTKYKKVFRERWNPYDEKPIDDVAGMCFLLRRVTNESPDRVLHLTELLLYNDRVIIFYNFTFELEILRQVCSELKLQTSEYNGQNHDPLPTGDKWVYLCQYTASSEGWNCTTTNVIIFYSLNYSYKTMLQAEGRINRLNTPFKELHYYYLKSKSPIDIGIQRALSQKRKFNERAFLQNAQI